MPLAPDADTAFNLNGEFAADPFGSYLDFAAAVEQISGGKRAVLRRIRGIRFAAVPPAAAAALADDCVRRRNMRRPVSDRAARVQRKISAPSASAWICPFQIANAGARSLSSVIPLFFGRIRCTMPGRNTAFRRDDAGIGVQINSLNALCARHIHASAKCFARSCNADAHDSFHAGNLDRVFGIRAQRGAFPARRDTHPPPSTRCRRILRPSFAAAAARIWILRSKPTCSPPTPS